LTVVDEDAGVIERVVIVANVQPDRPSERSPTAVPLAEAIGRAQRLQLAECDRAARSKAQKREVVVGVRGTAAEGRRVVAADGLEHYWPWRRQQFELDRHTSRVSGVCGAAICIDRRPHLRLEYGRLRRIQRPRAVGCG